MTDWRFASIGHSNRPRHEVIGMLREAGIGLLVDVRSFPKSRGNPDYNVDVLPDVLAGYQIGYLHMPALGGRRPKQPDIPEEVNAFWRVQSFHNYADYALGNEFRTAFERLVDLGAGQRLAMMCAEAVWWRCHRRIITDYLLLNGHEVRHLMAPGRAIIAQPTEAATRRGDGGVVYPAAPGDAAAVAARRIG